MKRKNILVCLIIVLILIICALIYIIITNFYNTDYKKFSEKTTTPTTKIEETTTSDITSPTTEKITEAPKPKNPIDFKKLNDINKDAYAWIKLPKTKIDYPILQSYKDDDFFYLDHNIYRQYEFAGSIYSEKNNSKDFLDPNTVIYGHDMLNGSMFQNLHLFSDKKFFDKNEFFYIYTPTRKLTYQIFSAYIYDNRHILNSFDFSDEKVFEKYLKDCQNPKSVDVNTRKNVILNKDSKIVTLSTCVGYDKNSRYLVQGVLIKDEETK